MSCNNCEEYQPYIDKTDCELLEVFVNQQTECLEVHFCNKVTVLDYEQIKIKHCPFCGEKLNREDKK